MYGVGIVLELESSQSTSAKYDHVIIKPEPRELNATDSFDDQLSSKILS